MDIILQRNGIPIFGTKNNRIIRNMIATNDKEYANIYDEIINCLEQNLKQAKDEKDFGLHYTDCSVYNEPAYPAGSCDCKD